MKTRLYAALCAIILTAGCSSVKAGDPTPTALAPAVAPLTGANAVTAPADAPVTAPASPTPSFPVAVNGPDGTPVVTVDADGTVRGDPVKLERLLIGQKGNMPQESVLLALVLRALREDTAKAPRPQAGPLDISRSVPAGK